METQRLIKNPIRAGATRAAPAHGGWSGPEARAERVRRPALFIWTFAATRERRLAPGHYREMSGVARARADLARDAGER